MAGESTANRASELQSLPASRGGLSLHLAFPFDRLRHLLSQVFNRAADDSQGQRFGHVAKEFRAGDLADDVFFRDRLNFARLVGEDVNNVSQVAVIECRKSHRDDEFINFEAEAHCLHMAVEGRTGGKFRVDLSHAGSRVDALLLADFGFDSDEAPAGFNVITTRCVHAFGIFVTVVGHPFREGLRAARFEDGHLVHADRFLLDDTDFVFGHLKTALEPGEYFVLRAAKSCVLREEPDSQVDDDFRRIDGGCHMREDVVGDFADFGDRWERDQHAELVDFALKTGPDDERFYAVFVEHISFLLSDASDRHGATHVNRRDHSAGVGLGGLRWGQCGD